MKMRQTLLDWNPISRWRFGVDADRGVSGRGDSIDLEATDEAESPEQRPVVEDAAVNPAAMTRGQIVDRIVRLNRTVSAEYLDQFDEEELALYLSHLLSAAQPRGGQWLRPADSPAIVSRARLI